MKAALITGSSRGIGAATAKRLAREGYAVAINYNANAAAAEAVRAEIVEGGGRAECFKADVSNERQAKALVRAAADSFGRLDVLVNNAGVAMQKLFTLVTAEELQYMFGVNLFSAVYCSQAAAEIMVSAKRGSIVNISSMWGQTGASCETVYSAAKAGMIGLTKALAKELGLSGVRVNCVSPGVIDTDMNCNIAQADLCYLADGTPLGQLGRREDVAEAVLFLCSEGARFITGQVLGVNGGFVV